MASSINQLISYAQSEVSSALSALQNATSSALGGIIFSRDPQITIPNNISQSATIPEFTPFSVTDGSISLVQRKEMLDSYQSGISGVESLAGTADPGGFVSSLWVSPAMPIDDIGSVPLLNMPDAPSMNAPSRPDDISLSARVVQLNESLVPIGNITTAETPLPDLDGFNFVGYDEPIPNIGDITPPNGIFNYQEQIFVDEFRDIIMDAISGDLSHGGGGINDMDEQALVSRAKDRESSIYIDQSEAMARRGDMSGFPIPTMRKRKLDGQLYSDYLGKLGDVSRTVFLDRSDRYFKARQSAITNGINLDQIITTFKTGELQRLFETAQYASEVTFKAVETNRVFAQIKLDLWRAGMEQWDKNTLNMMRKLEVFNAELMLSGAEDKRDEKRMAMANLANSAATIIEEQRRVQLELARTETEIDRLAIALHDSQWEAYSKEIAGIGVLANSYGELINGQVQTLKPIEISADILGKRIDIAKVSNDIGKSRYEASIAGHKENLARLEQYQNYLIQLKNNIVSKVNIVSAGDDESIKKFESLFGATKFNTATDLVYAKAKIDALIEPWQTHNQALGVKLQAESSYNTNLAGIYGRGMEAQATRMSAAYGQTFAISGQNEELETG